MVPDSSALRRCETLLESASALLEDAAALEHAPPRLPRDARTMMVTLLEACVREVGALTDTRPAVPLSARLWELGELEDEFVTVLAFHGWTLPDDRDDPPLLTEALDESA